jgi:hypothetical protein
MFTSIVCTAVLWFCAVFAFQDNLDQGTYEKPGAREDWASPSDSETSAKRQEGSKNPHRDDGAKSRSEQGESNMVDK